MVGTGRRNGRVPRIGGGWPPRPLFQKPSGDFHFLIGELPLQGRRNRRDRFAPDRQRPVTPFHARIEVTFQAWIQGREVGSGVRAAALPALERAAKRRLCRTESGPQIEYLAQLEPSFLTRADVDHLGGLLELAQFPEALPDPRLIATDPTVLPHQIAECPLQGTRQLASWLDQTLDLVFGLLHRFLGATLDFGFARMGSRRGAGPPPEDDRLGE